MALHGIFVLQPIGRFQSLFCCGFIADRLFGARIDVIRFPASKAIKGVSVQGENTQA